MSTPSNTELQALIDGATPGPWKYRERVMGLPSTTVTAGDLSHVAYPIAQAGPGTARLIAAAPDIAAELITVRADHDHLASEVDRLRDGIKALIEKYGDHDRPRSVHRFNVEADLRALLDGEAKG